MRAALIALRRCRQRPTFAFVALCSYVFFKEMKPSESYLTSYLVDNKGFTEEVTYDLIYPVSTYATLVCALMAICFLDLLGYQLSLVIEALSYLATRCLLVWGTTLFEMQLMQVFYGIATAMEIAYFCYAFAHLSSAYSSHTLSGVLRAVYLLGSLTRGIVGQAVVSAVGASGYMALNVTSLISVSVACLVIICVPSTVQDDEADSTTLAATAPSHDDDTGKPGRRVSLRYMARSFIQFYSDARRLEWSIWWSLGVCGLYQVLNYNQNLWNEVAGGNSQWNGLVDALASLCGALCAISPGVIGRLRSQGDGAGGVGDGWRRHRRWWLVLGAGVGAVLLLWMANTTSVLQAYAGYILFRGTMALMLTVAATEIAAGSAAVASNAAPTPQQADNNDNFDYSWDHDTTEAPLLTGLGRGEQSDCGGSSCSSSSSVSAQPPLFGVFFGANTFMALVFQSLLQLAVGQHGLALTMRPQFRAYACFFGGLAGLFGVAQLWGVARRRWRSRSAVGGAVSIQAR